MPTLNFVLSPTAAQKLHDTLSCLSKFSEYVSIEARRNRLSFVALNSTKSAYAATHLSANRFFSSYRFVPDQRRDDEKFTCRLLVKALLAVFRQRYFDARGGDTTIEKCEVRFDENPSRAECRLTIKLICKHGVVKTYKLTYEEVDVLHATFHKDDAPNHWRISSKALKEYGEHFGLRAEQLEIASKDGRAAFTSYTEKLIDGKDILKQPLQTSVSLDQTDFEEFDVKDDIHVGISLKDFKAIVAHADSLDISVSAYLSEPGRPMQLSYGREGLDCEFTLMTLGDVRSSQAAVEQPAVVSSAASRASARAPSARRNGSPSLPPQSQLAQSQPPPISQQASQPLASARPRQESNDEDLRRMPLPPLHAEPFEYQPQSHSFSQPPVQQRSQPAALPSLMEISPPERQQEVDAKLFLSYSSDEDDEDLNEDLDKMNEPVIRWDTGGNMPPVPVARDQTDAGKDDDETEDEEDMNSTGIGPTQVTQVKGLFD